MRPTREIYQPKPPSPLVEALIEEYEVVRALLIRAGLDLKTVAYKRQSIDDAGPEALFKAVNWLKAFRAKEIREYELAYLLVTPAEWEAFARMEVKGLLEQDILRKALMDMRLVWSCRPHILRKKNLEGRQHERPKPKKPSIEADSEQPPEPGHPDDSGSGEPGLLPEAGSGGNPGGPSGECGLLANGGAE